jgi:hypothetical protein
LRILRGTLRIFREVIYPEILLEICENFEIWISGICRISRVKDFEDFEDFEEFEDFEDFEYLGILRILIVSRV